MILALQLLLLPISIRRPFTPSLILVDVFYPFLVGNHALLIIEFGGGFASIMRGGEAAEFLGAGDGMSGRGVVVGGGQNGRYSELAICDHLADFVGVVGWDAG